jgi:hypothetical protein
MSSSAPSATRIGIVVLIVIGALVGAGLYASRLGPPEGSLASLEAPPELSEFVWNQDKADASPGSIIRHRLLVSAYRDAQVASQSKGRNRLQSLSVSVARALTNEYGARLSSITGAYPAVEQFDDWTDTNHGQVVVVTCPTATVVMRLSPYRITRQADGSLRAEARAGVEVTIRVFAQE